MPDLKLQSKLALELGSNLIFSPEKHIMFSFIASLTSYSKVNTSSRYL